MPGDARRPGSRRRRRSVGVGASLKSLEDREVDVRVEVAERQHLEVLEEPLDRLDARRAASGTTTIVRALSGMPGGEIEAGQPPRRDERGDDALDQQRRRARSPASARAGPRRSAICGARAPVARRRVGDAPRTPRPVSEADAAEVRRRGVGEGRSGGVAGRDEGGTRRRSRGRGGPGRSGDSRRARRVSPIPLRSRRLARALDRAQGDAHLRLAARLGELLHGLPVAVAAQEIHARVDRRPDRAAGPAPPG